MAKALRQSALPGNRTAAPRRCSGLCIALCLAILPLLASVVIFTDNHPDLRERFDCAACKSGEDLSSADAQAAPAPALQDDTDLLPPAPMEIRLSGKTPGTMVRPRPPPV